MLKLPEGKSGMVSKHCFTNMNYTSSKPLVSQPFLESFGHGPLGNSQLGHAGWIDRLEQASK